MACLCSDSRCPACFCLKKPRVELGQAGAPALPARLKMLGPGCALPFTSGPHKATHLAMRDRTDTATNLVAWIFVANLVRIERCAASTCNRTYECALLTAERPSEQCACTDTSCRCDFVARAVPNRSVVIITAVSVIA